MLAGFNDLVRQASALYQSHHYGSYHFLMTLSDQVAHFGLEHHQSNDDRVPEKTFLIRIWMRWRRASYPTSLLIHGMENIVVLKDCCRPISRRR